MLGTDTPHISALATEGFARPLQAVFPAVTCSVQSSLLTGLLPREHGIVGNGWYDRELAEVLFGDSRIDSFMANVFMTRPDRSTRRIPLPRCFGGTTCMQMSTIP